MADKLKTLIEFTFYYPDTRPDAPSAFAGNAILVDEDAGETMEMDLEGRGHYDADKKLLAWIPADKWLWMERRERTIKVKE